MSTSAAVTELIIENASEQRSRQGFCHPCTNLHLWFSQIGPTPPSATCRRLITRRSTIQEITRNLRDLDYPSWRESRTLPTKPVNSSLPPGPYTHFLMSRLPVTIETFEAMVKQCLRDVRHPSGNRQRRRARQLHGARDAAILSLSYLYGASTSELLGLEWRHCRVPEYGVGSITFLDRPDRSQDLPLIGPTRIILRLWRDYSSGEALFHRISKLGKEGPGSLTPSAIRATLKKRHNQIGRQKRGKKVPTPARLRSSFKQLLDTQGTKDAIVRDIMGLSSRRQAPRNDDRDDARMKKALKKVSNRVNVISWVPSP